MPNKNRDRPIDIRLGQPIPVSGLVVSETDTESKFGLMVHAMRGTGKTIEHKVSESSRILTEISMKATG